MQLFSPSRSVPAPAWILCRPWSLCVVCLLHCRALLLPWPFHYLFSSLCSFFLSSHFFCVPSSSPAQGFLPFLRYIYPEAPYWWAQLCPVIELLWSCLELGLAQGNPWTLPMEDHPRGHSAAKTLRSVHSTQSYCKPSGNCDLGSCLQI